LDESFVALTVTDLRSLDCPSNQVQILYANRAKTIYSAYLRIEPHERFLTFLKFFYFAQRFLFKKRALKIPSKAS